MKGLQICESKIAFLICIKYNVIHSSYDDERTLSSRKYISIIRLVMIYTKQFELRRKHILASSPVYLDAQGRMRVVYIEKLLLTYPLNTPHSSNANA